MLDIKFIRQNPEAVKQAMKNRGVDADIERILELDKRNKEVLQEFENGRAEQNKASSGPKSKEEIEQLKALKEKIKVLEQEHSKLSAELESAISILPNIPLEDTPIGKDASDNVVLREVGKRPQFSFEPKTYVELGESLGIIDTETAGQVSGARFAYLKGGAALLAFALTQLALNFVTDEANIKRLIRRNNLKIFPKAFVPVLPPVMIKPEMMSAMGYMGQHAEEIYHLKDDPLVLIGTSEQSIGAMHHKKIIEAKDLPLRYFGFSTCFRREAGSYGKDTKGILRVHQFDKSEMFTVCQPDDSSDEHKLMLAIEEHLMQELELPYRVVRLSTGDIGTASAGTYDIETWLPGQNEYRETHSTSNTTDYQSRRLQTRYKTESGNELVHMLNGTVFSTNRPIIAILENYQTKNGTVAVPKALRKYTGLKEIK